MIGGTTISGFVITYNEEAAIRDCLESMKWADELVVVDSFSQDATVGIAREYTDKVIQREFARSFGAWKDTLPASPSSRPPVTGSCGLTRTSA